MSGHSKWATTKHKKAILDSRRAKTFAKLIKAIEVAARTGGPDPAGNPTLFDALAKARKIRFHQITSIAQLNVGQAWNLVALIGKPSCMKAMALME